MKFTLCILLFFGLSFEVFAHKSIKKHFEDFYYSNQISDRHCGQNISRFIKHLASNGHDISDIAVLNMTAPDNPWSFGRVIGLNARTGRYIPNIGYQQNWEFHVVAIYKGEVYDFSFGKKPEVLPVLDYLFKMFIPNEPFMINGDTFRTRGMGPYFTPEHAIDELEEYVLTVYKSDHNGVFTELKSGLKFKDLGY